MITAVIILAVVAVALGGYIVFDIVHGKKKKTVPDTHSNIYYPNVKLDNTAPTETVEEPEAAAEDVEPTAFRSKP